VRQAQADKTEDNVKEKWAVNEEFLDKNTHKMKL
jgi:hypothetical protein